MCEFLPCQLHFYHNCQNPSKKCNSSHAPFAKPRFQRFSAASQLFLLMKWRSLRTFTQAASHASMESACMNVRVSCNIICKRGHFPGHFAFFLFNGENGIIDFKEQH